MAALLNLYFIILFYYFFWGGGGRGEGRGVLRGHQHSSLANVDVFSVYFLGGEKRRSEIRLRSQATNVAEVTSCVKAV